MTSTPTQPRPNANANGRAGSAIVQSEGSPDQGDAGSSPARAADFSGCTCTVPPANEDLACRDCHATAPWTFDGYTLTGSCDTFTVTTICGVGEDWNVRRGDDVVVGLPDAALLVMRAFYRAHPTRCGSCVWCVPQAYRVIGGVSR